MKRFSRIRYAMQKLKASGGAVDEFKNYLTGVNTIKRGAVEGSLLKTEKGLNPFGRAVDAAQNFQVRVTARSISGYTAAGVSDTILNLLANDSKTKKFHGFRPAQVVVRVTDNAAAPTPTVSGITKMSYKKKLAKSYTFPFGRKEAADTLETVAKAISAEVLATETRSLTFKPERIL